MRYLIYLVLFLITFFLGFIIHALYFPDVLSNGIVSIPTNPFADEPDASPTPYDATKLNVKISFNGERFDRTNVTIQQSRYLQIVNESKDQLMLLSSSNSVFATPRGYGYSEKILVRMDDKGQFTVLEKNSGAKTVITVK